MSALKTCANAAAVAAVSILLSACTRSPSVVSDHPSSKIDFHGSWNNGISKRVSREAYARPGLPAQGLLVAIIRWGSTTLAALDLRNGALIPIVTRPSGEMDIAVAPDRVAYLVREGVDPCQNYVEILDSRQGYIYRLKPESGFAILGFSLGSRPTELIFTEMNLRESRSRRAYWRTVLADVGTGEGRVALSSDSRNPVAEAIPVPLGRSTGTGEFYFRGLLPFRGMINGGIWQMDSDRRGPKKIVPETAYVGHPQLSPDGDFIAYLSTDIESLPVSDIRAPGAPPANVLAVMDVRTGWRTSAAQKTGAALACLRWSASGDEILAVRRKWLDGRFRDRDLLTGTKEGSFQLAATGFSPSADAVVTDIAKCERSSLLWIEKGVWGTRLRNAGADRETTTPLALRDGEIRIIGCLKGGR